MKENCKPRCDTHGKKVQKLIHTKVGAVHVLSSLGCMEGLVPGMFQAQADYESGDGFLVNSQEYAPMFQGGVFKKGKFVFVLVDTQSKRLGLASGNAQAVMDALERHMADATAHIAEEDRQVWNNKADRASNAAAGNLAALDAVGNPVDSGKAAEDFEAVGSVQAVREELAGQLGEIRTSLSNKAESHNTVLTGTASLNNEKIATATAASMFDLPITPGLFKPYAGNLYSKNQMSEVSFTAYLETVPGVTITRTQVLGTLPEGFRPKYNIWFVAYASGPSVVAVCANGNLIYYGGNVTNGTISFSAHYIAV